MGQEVCEADVSFADGASVADALNAFAALLGPGGRRIVRHLWATADARHVPFATELCGVSSVLCIRAKLCGGAPRRTVLDLLRVDAESADCLEGALQLCNLSDLSNVLQLSYSSYDFQHFHVVSKVCVLLKIDAWHIFLCVRTLQHIH